MIAVAVEGSAVVAAEQSEGLGAQQGQTKASQLRYVMSSRLMIPDGFEATSDDDFVVVLLLPMPAVD